MPMDTFKTHVILTVLPLRWYIKLTVWQPNKYTRNVYNVYVVLSTNERRPSPIRLPSRRAIIASRFSSLETRFLRERLPNRQLSTRTLS